MSILNLENMQTKDKFIALEELWADLSKNVDEKELTPNWHLDILDKREKNTDFQPLDEAKKQLQSLLK